MERPTHWECGDCSWSGDKPEDGRCPACGSDYVHSWAWWNSQ